MVEDDKIIILKQDINAQTLMFEQISESNLNQNYEFIIVNTGMEALQILTQMGSGCLLFSISTKNELQELAVVMKRLKKEIKNNLFKVSGYNNIDNKKVSKFLKDHHITEVFEAELNLKSIEFKFNLWFKSIQAARKTYSSLLGDDLLADSSTKKSGEKLDGKMKGSTAVKNPVKYLPPLDLHSDCFIFTDKKHAKNVMNSWIIEIIGPGPASGRWHDISKKVNSTTPVWKWVPTREDLFTFILDDGYWIFKGREPMFNWESNLWKLSGNSPELTFYTDKPVANKFYIENNQLNITKTSEQAKAKLSMLKESFDPKYSMSHDNITDKETGVAETEKISMFYKGGNKASNDLTEDSKSESQNTYKEENQTGTITGQSKSVEKVGDQIHNKKSSINNFGDQANKHKAASIANFDKEDRTNKTNSFTENLDTNKSKQGQGYQESLNESKTGSGFSEQLTGNLVGRGTLTEGESQSKNNIDKSNIVTQDKKQQKKSQEQSLESSFEDELEELKDLLNNEIEADNFERKSKELAEASKKKTTLEIAAKENTGKPAHSSEAERKDSRMRSRTAALEDNHHAGSLSGILDAPVDLGAQDTNEFEEELVNSTEDNEEQLARRANNTQKEDKEREAHRSDSNSKNRSNGKFGQNNDSIQDEHGDLHETDKDWEKYYRGGSAKKDKETKDNSWGGPSGNKNSFNQKSKGEFGEDGDQSESNNSDGPLSGKINTAKQTEKDEKKKAFDDYMASLKPKAPKVKPKYGEIGKSNINFSSVTMELILKTQSTKGQLFDISEKTELLDLIDNIIVVKNIGQKTYALHTQMLIQCYVHYSNKEYDFTISGRLSEIEGENDEILNLELTKYSESDLENLLVLFTERQNNIVDFINAAQGKE